MDATITSVEPRNPLAPIEAANEAADKSAGEFSDGGNQHKTSGEQRESRVFQNGKVSG
jgi:hypothetical protein